MSSFQLPLTTPSADAPSPQSRLPIDLSFSPNKDTLVALWETGYVTLTDLRVRIGPGRGKVMDPVLTWKGVVEGPVSEYRQVIALDTDGTTSKIAVLGSSCGQDSKDAVTVLSIDGAATERVTVSLPGRNGRLVPSDEFVWWQSPEGEILKGGLDYVWFTYDELK